MAILDSNSYTFHEDDRYWLYKDAERDLEVYVSGSGAAMEATHWQNAESVIDRIDFWVERAHEYVRNTPQIEAEESGRWYAMWFGFGAPHLGSPVEFHIAFEREHDVYGLWAVWFVKRDDSWRPYRISRQNW